MSFENIISHSIGCLFYLLMVSYAIQKLVHWIKSHSFIFALISFALGDRSPKIIATLYVKELLPMFSSSFMVSSLMFRSLIHCEFIFVYGMTKCSNFFILHPAVQFSHHHVLKRLSFLYCEFCSLCHRFTDHKHVGLFLNYLFCSSNLCVFICASSILFWWL